MKVMTQINKKEKMFFFEFLFLKNVVVAQTNYNQIINECKHMIGY